MNRRRRQVKLLIALYYATFEGVAGLVEMGKCPYGSNPLNPPYQGDLGHAP